MEYIILGAVGLLVLAIILRKRKSDGAGDSTRPSKPFDENDLR